MAENLNNVPTSLKIDVEKEKNPFVDLNSIYTEFTDVKTGFKDLKEEWKKADQKGNNNGITEANEAVNHLLTSPNVFPKLMGWVGGIYTLITSLAGILGNGINWIFLSFGIILILVAAAIYFIFENNAKGTVQTIDRLSQENRKIIQKYEIGFNDYQKKKKIQLEKAYIEIDGLKEQKYQMLGDNSSKSYHIGLLQEEIKRLKEELAKPKT